MHVLIIMKQTHHKEIEYTVDIHVCILFTLTTKHAPLPFYTLQMCADKFFQVHTYLQISRNVGTCQYACGRREEDSKDREETLVCAIKPPEIRNKVSLECVNCIKEEMEL